MLLGDVVLVDVSLGGVVFMLGCLRNGYDVARALVLMLLAIKSNVDLLSFFIIFP